MPYLGEILALIVAVLWTISSLASETASKHYGSLLLNILRMVEAIVLIGATLWIVNGTPLPIHCSRESWGYLSLSALTGYVIGDFFFLQCFILIGARWGELFMTIAPLAAALTGWALLGEKMSGLAWAGLAVTTAGICMSVLSKSNEGKKVKIKLPLKGVVYGLIAGIGQGVGLVFSKMGTMVQSQELSNVAGGSFIMAFEATLIRSFIALAGFVALYAFFRGIGKEKHPISLLFSSKRIFLLASTSTVFGPFIGVSLSIAATLFTSTGITQTLMSLIPVLILWPSHILFKTKITVREVIGAIISVCGVALFFI